MGGEGGGETKDGEEKNKTEDDNKQNRTKPKRNRTQKKWVSTKGEMDGWGGAGRAGQEHWAASCTTWRARGWAATAPGEVCVCRTAT